MDWVFVIYLVSCVMCFCLFLRIDVIFFGSVVSLVMLIDVLVIVLCIWFMWRLSSSSVVICVEKVFVDVMVILGLVCV